MALDLGLAALRQSLPLSWDTEKAQNHISEIFRILLAKQVSIRGGCGTFVHDTPRNGWEIVGCVCYAGCSPANSQLMGAELFDVLTLPLTL